MRPIVPEASGEVKRRAEARGNGGRSFQRPPRAIEMCYLSSGGNLKSAMFASSCTPAELISIDVER